MSTKFTTNSLQSNPLSDKLREIFDEDRYFRHENIGKYLINGLGGTAEHLVLAQNTGDLVEAAKAAIANKKPYIVIAHGTGSLVSEIGFPGLVIINQTTNMVFPPDKSEAIVDSGVSNSELVNLLASRGYGGLEFLAGIPGTIGGAVATGAERHGQKVLSYVKEIILFMPEKEDGKVMTIKTSELPKRDNKLLFSSFESPPIILGVRLQLAKITEPEIMRRLKLVRKEIDVRNTFGRFGHYLYPEIISHDISLKDLMRLPLPKGIKIDHKNPDILYYSQINTPGEIRQAIEAVGDFMRQNGCTLEQAIVYLGYWPSREENSTDSTDTESF